MSSKLFQSIKNLIRRNTSYVYVENENHNHASKNTMRNVSYSTNTSGNNNDVLSDPYSISTSMLNDRNVEDCESEKEDDEVTITCHVTTIIKKPPWPTNDGDSNWTGFGVYLN